MLLYDPPPDAVEAVLRAYPMAALDAATHDGATALRIAAERSGRSYSYSSHGGAGGVASVPPSSLRVMRLLLVAELAMARRMGDAVDERRRRARSSRRRRRDGGGGDGDAAISPPSRPVDGVVVVDASLGTVGDDVESDEEEEEEDTPSSSAPFFGHNPIIWTAEQSVPVGTAAMLLKWYPVGAFQRRRNLGGGDDGEEVGVGDDNDEADSPLIRIVDDFARDNCGVVDAYFEDDDEDGVGGLGGGDDAYDTWGLGDYVGSVQSAGSMNRIASMLYQRRERRRREQRWEKFLHILYATDTTLQSRRKPPPPDDGGGTSEEGGGVIDKVAPNLPDSTSPNASDVDRRAESAAGAIPDNATTGGPSIAIASVVPGQSSSKNDNDPTGASSCTATTASNTQTGSATANATNGIKKPSITPFHPVHAWLRCLTSPNLGLEHCQAYGAWSILRDMERRIPNEFTVRDITDGNRTAFQTLAECKAKDCKLCPAEIRDIVECLMDANHRSAFL
jgi:hypothetical protein